MVASKDDGHTGPPPANRMETNMRSRILMAVLLAALSLTPFASARASNGARVALSIGVSAYQSSPLPSPVKDASEVANALAGFGFDVTLVQDPNSAEFRAAVEAFIAKARGASSAVVYFSGHGIQVNGEVYMMASDTRIDRPDLYQRDEMTVNGIVDRLQAAGVDFKFVIVDACRSNPFLDANGRNALAAANAGRAERRRPATNTLVSFASASGQNSQDWGNSIGLSLYTAALLDVMKRNERIDVRDLTQQARAVVQDYIARHNGSAQMPWEGSSLMRPVVLERTYTGQVAHFRGAASGRDYAAAPSRREAEGRREARREAPSRTEVPADQDGPSIADVRPSRRQAPARAEAPATGSIREEGALSFDTRLERRQQGLEPPKPRGQGRRSLMAEAQGY